MIAVTTSSPMNITLLAEKTPSEFVCDHYFEISNASMHQGIRGLKSQAFYENIKPKFGDTGEAISNNTKESEWNLGGNPRFFYITTDIYTSFVMLVGIFFPSCTGKRICIIFLTKNKSFAHFAQAKNWKVFRDEVKMFAHNMKIFRFIQKMKYNSLTNRGLGCFKSNAMPCAFVCLNLQLFNKTLDSCSDEIS